MVVRNKFTKIEKRDGRIVDFEQEKITNAIFKTLTVTNQGGQRIAKRLSDKVIVLLNKRYKKDHIPHVEEIQDIVEEVLILEDYAETARSYILYREQHRKIREMEIATKESLDMISNYVEELDWQVHENSNMTYSLQGLHDYVSSFITKRYWLNKVYPKEIREAVYSGDFHIHDLGYLATYCCGWDLTDLLIKGFRGASGKVETSSAKHFRVALGQIVNFFYTLQGETAGAEAFSNFDTLLAPFIRCDDLDYKQVKQAIQEFVYNSNVPTRTGFQCISQDTEILTQDGWRGYDEIKRGDMIKTFNIENNRIENQEVTSIFKSRYKGMMYNLKNRIQDQLISPKHRVVRKRFNTENYTIEPIEDVLKLKSPFIIPVAGENSNKEAEISDEQIKLMTWIISEGSIEKPGKRRKNDCRISIYQSKIANRRYYNEIIKLLKHFKLKHWEYETAALGNNVCRMRLNAESSKKIHEWFGTNESVHFVPDILLNLSERQSRLFIDTYLKADGFEGCKIATTDSGLLDSLQIMCVNAGYGFTVLKRRPTIGTKDIYVLRLVRHKETYIQKVKKINYNGVIWCPHTKNETIIARRKGKVFITGNTPFTNITMDLVVPDNLRDVPVIIGGKPQKETYKEFQKEMDMLNQAFAEVMTEGDATGRVFTFPIPTYNITKNFNWNNPILKPIWEMTAKYGIPYFANFINSDMNPEDVRSMCCRLKLDNRELYKRGGGLFGAAPLTGSIGVVTINMPRIGYLSKTKEEFFSRLSHLMDVAKESLEIKRKTLETFTEKGLYPYAKFYLDGVKKMRRNYWGNHFSTIGLIGMNEALLNFIKKDIASSEGRKFTIEILNFMRDRLLKYQEETGNMYNLEATPGEGTSYRLARIDKNQYPDIITAGNSEPYYTNSTQLPVDYTNDLFTALKLQDDIQKKYSGGTVLHGFLGEKISNSETVKNLIKKIFSKFHLPYFTLTPTFSICPHHGYLSGEHWTCPKCTIEQLCEVYSRIVGYLRPVQQWNKGKQEEFKERLEFKIKA